ncbi:uncharacterized protein LOC106174523 [Lingula anatina]|uniref:Uncharacterized protein LOC106174523 n=1 Tax=Lingula anatina TaxID=7574 RepID=A0A1S3JMI4_LINAN|nr:uncharacterized protein LOC106174523 [Lingula anatina]|eukprot:XP_013411577.1 uncharacterized protein LOC106174523 [Lingula anatina]
MLSRADETRSKVAELEVWNRGQTASGIRYGDRGQTVNTYRIRHGGRGQTISGIRDGGRGQTGSGIRHGGRGQTVSGIRGGSRGQTIAPVISHLDQENSGRERCLESQFHKGCSQQNTSGEKWSDNSKVQGDMEDDTSDWYESSDEEWSDKCKASIIELATNYQL